MATGWLIAFIEIKYYKDINRYETRKKEKINE